MRCAEARLRQLRRFLALPEDRRRGQGQARGGSGEAEVHETTNHVFIIVEGEATMVTGGKLVDAKQTQPGQIRGTSVAGGQTHRLSKGDVITIPAKTPHWWREVPTKTVAYYAVNIEN